MTTKSKIEINGKSYTFHVLMVGEFSGICAEVKCGRRIVGETRVRPTGFIGAVIDDVTALAKADAAKG